MCSLTTNFSRFILRGAMAHTNVFRQMLAILMLLSTLSCAQRPLGEPLSQLPRDASHIFNALLSSMRQFGSSINHNGMSLFLAHVPADTQFYHGRGSPDRVKGMEWLAFEPEHALTFAFYIDPPRKPHPPSDQAPFAGNMALANRMSSLQLAMLDDNRPERPELKPGWLHTYRTKHPLRLIYVDGMSAGKTNNGTLDFEDKVLLRDNSTHKGFWDPVRAEGLCSIAAEEWAGKIDGILRMEAGFEIILCDFEQHLDEVHVSRIGKSGEKIDENSYSDVFFNYWRAVSDRFDDIGGDRVSIYYDHFITAFGRDIDLFTNNSTMPRLLSANDSQLSSVRSAVDDLVALSPSIFADIHHWTNWQSTADMIVTRYANRIHYLRSPTFHADLPALHAELDRILTPFIDYDARNPLAELTACTTHFLPNTTHPSHASDAVSAVHNALCEALFAALQCSRPGADECAGASAYQILDDLAEWLDWTVWKRCGACAVDELCVVPAWPYGSLEDHERPKCRNASTAWEQRGYWGRPGS